MSYNTTYKTKYGDELMDDTAKPQSTTNYLPQPQATGASARFGSRLEADQSMSSIPNNPAVNQAQLSMQQTIPALTPEDLLLMRNWQRDSFYYRVLPLTILAVGGLYLRQKRKGLPFKLVPYALVTFGCFVAGKSSYLGELRRRISESPSSTPFMEAMRKNLKLPVRGGSEFSSEYTDGNNQATFPTSEWGAYSSSSSRIGLPADSNLTLSDSSTSYFTNQPSEQSDLQSKPQLSYDELRAKNRGFMK